MYFELRQKLLLWIGAMYLFKNKTKQHYKPASKQQRSRDNSLARAGTAHEQCPRATDRCMPRCLCATVVCMVHVTATCRIQIYFVAVNLSLKGELIDDIVCNDLASNICL